MATAEANGKTSDIPAESALKKEAALIQNEFQQTWGWINLFRNLAEYVHTSLFEILENRNVLETFTLCTMMIEDSERATITYKEREN